MICPKCKMDAVDQDKDTVKCSNCGFTAPLLEYKAWKGVYLMKPGRMKAKTVFHENEDNDTFTGTFAGPEDKNITVIMTVLFIIVFFILLATML